jgi:hypothetical protein
MLKVRRTILRPDGSEGRMSLYVPGDDVGI